MSIDAYTIEDELIKEIISLKDAYGIRENDFGVFLLAMGVSMMIRAGDTKDDICDMIRSGK